MGSMDAQGMSPLDMPWPTLALEFYPQLNKLTNDPRQHHILGIFYFNRTVQYVAETISNGRLPRDVTPWYLASLLMMLCEELDHLAETDNTGQLSQFIQDERTRLGSNQQRCKAFLEC